MDVTKTFANNLKQQRIFNNLTQKELAQIIDYSEKSVSKWETGKSIPPAELLPKLSEVLHLSIDDLFSAGNEPVYFLGIDGGGTKTEFLLTNKDGEVIKNLILGACNPVDVGMDKTFRILEEGIMTACKGVFLSKISVFAGIAGGITGSNKKKIHDFLEKFKFCKFDNDSDAMNAVETALGNNNGITVILGTGDIAFTKIDGKLYRTGGFGYLFDDGGSGYAIGRDALLEVLNDEQLEREESLLAQTIKEHMGIDNFIGNLDDFYQGGKRKIASVAPAVFVAYEKGDRSAAQILDSNFKAVAQLIIDASRHFNDETIEVKILGSVSKGKDVVKLIKRHLEALAPFVDFDISICTERPVYGAMRLAGLKKEIKNA